MAKNILAPASRVLFLDLIGELLFFPIWWYSVGLKNIILSLWSSLREAERNLGLRLLLKNMFQPMFGQSDRQGRIISFFMRLLIVAYKLVLYLVRIVFCLVVIFFWLLLPVLVVFGIIYNLPGLWQK